MKKIISKFLAVVLACVLFLDCVPVYAASAKKTQLNQTSVTLLVGTTTSLRLLHNTSGKEPKFKSGNKKIATVDKSGLITAKKKGSCTITVAVGGKSYKCKVKVIKKYAAKTVKKKVTVSKKVENGILEFKIVNKLAVALDIHLVGYAISPSGQTTQEQYNGITVPANATVRRYYDLGNNVNFKIEQKIYQYFGFTNSSKDVVAYNSGSGFVMSHPTNNIVAYHDSKAFVVNNIEEQETFWGTSLVISYTEDYSRIPYDSPPLIGLFPYTVVFYKKGKMVNYKRILPSINVTDGKYTGTETLSDCTKADYDSYKVMVNPLIYYATDGGENAKYSQ